MNHVSCNMVAFTYCGGRSTKYVSSKKGRGGEARSMISQCLKTKHSEEGGGPMSSSTQHHRSQTVFSRVGTDDKKDGQSTTMDNDKILSFITTSAPCS